MGEEKIIGKRFTVPFQKSVIVAAVTLIILGVALLVLSFLSDSDPDSALVYLVLAIFVIVMAALTLVLEFVRYKKRKKMEGIPTVVMNDEQSIKVTLTNGKEVDVKLADITRIKSKGRITVGVGLVTYKVSTFNDGTLTLYLNNGSKVKVGEVAEVDAVQQKLYDLKNAIKQV